MISRCNVQFGVIARCQETCTFGVQKATTRCGSWPLIASTLAYLEPRRGGQSGNPALRWAFLKRSPSA